MGVVVLVPLIVAQPEPLPAEIVPADEKQRSAGDGQDRRPEGREDVVPVMPDGVRARSAEVVRERRRPVDGEDVAGAGDVGSNVGGRVADDRRLIVIRAGRERSRVTARVVTPRPTVDERRALGSATAAAPPGSLAPEPPEPPRRLGGDRRRSLRRPPPRSRSRSPTPPEAPCGSSSRRCGRRSRSRGTRARRRPPAAPPARAPRHSPSPRARPARSRRRPTRSPRPRSPRRTRRRRRPRRRSFRRRPSADTEMLAMFTSPPKRATLSTLAVALACAAAPGPVRAFVEATPNGHDAPVAGVGEPGGRSRGRRRSRRVASRDSVLARNLDEHRERRGRRLRTAGRGRDTCREPERGGRKRGDCEADRHHRRVAGRPPVSQADRTRLPSIATANRERTTLHA